MSIKLLSTLALVAFITPCTIFAASESTQNDTALFQSESPQMSSASTVESDNGSWKESIRLSVGAEAFYGFARKDLVPKEVVGESIDGIDLYGANLKLGMSFQSPSWKRYSQKVISEVFVLTGYGYGEDTLYEESYYDEHYKFTGTSTMFHVSAGVAINYEITEAFSISASGRLGICDSEFELECDFSDASGNINAEFKDNAFGFIYGAGVGAHWTIADRHKISLGVEFVSSTARPEIEIGEERFKLNEQNYVFFSVGYHLVF